MTTHEWESPIIVSLDMIKVSRILECFILPVQIPHPPEDEDKTLWCIRDIDSSIRMDSRITVTNGAKVTFEDSNINWIEANLQVATVEHKTAFQGENYAQP
jgi:hypothetical protein